MPTLYSNDRGFQPVTVDEVSRCLSGQKNFWLDIETPNESDYALLQNVFGFHPLSIEDIKHQNQRPKVDGYEGYEFVVLMVAAYANDQVSVREHHLFLSDRYVVSVHQEPEPLFADLQSRVADSPSDARDRPGFLAYLVMDVLVDGSFSALEALDEAVDRLQDEILVEANTRLLVLMQDLKHGVTELRRLLGAQRDMYQRLVTHSIDKLDREITAYYRDVYDHILRQYESVDSLRDLLTGAMDVYLSMVSNRLNLTMKALTVIASVFLPLTFLTGFFGMNFGWLVSRIAGFEAFAIGLGVMLVSIVVQLWLFRRRGWI